MKQMIRITSCVAAALALGGCQSFISALGFAPKESAQAEQLAEAFGSEELQKGQLALKQGHVAAAIQQFRMAALNEETAPDAFNGLGVAYARLGRADLAERYFKIAVELDSANPKFAANLARFYESPLGTSARAMAMRKREAEAMLALAEQEAVAQGLADATAETSPAARSAFVVDAPALEVNRASEREVRIVTSSAAKAGESVGKPEVAVRADEAPAPKAVETRAHISLIGRASPSAPRSEARPARITVSRAGGRWSSRPRAASYPVRVALKRED